MTARRRHEAFHPEKTRACAGFSYARRRVYSPSMTAPSRIATARSAILRWFGRNGRDLPWRRSRDPWAVLVSELMLQQTQVERVIPKYEAFLERWPTPAALAASPLGDVLRAWSGLGYNRRAKHLHEAAKAVVERFDGVVPRTVEALESLPGIGRYTSRAVASFAFNDDVALWDTNVRRIFLRVFAGGEFARRVPGEDALERLLTEALPKGKSRDWHGALMDFGSAVCTGRSPGCGECPLAASCVAAPKFLAGRTPKAALVKRQPAFPGSRRQGRGAIIRLLAERRGGVAVTEIAALSGRADADELLDALVGEGLVARRGGEVRLA